MALELAAPMAFLLRLERCFDFDKRLGYYYLLSDSKFPAIFMMQRDLISAN